MKRLHLPKKLLGGRVRTSTVALSLLLVAVLALYLVVRPPPESGPSSRATSTERQETAPRTTPTEASPTEAETSPTETGPAGDSPEQEETRPERTSPAPESGGRGSQQAPQAGAPEEEAEPGTSTSP